MATPTQSPKTMSDRLLTMKFMQRASASRGPPTGDERPAKRSRLSNQSTPASSPRTDASAVQAAVAAEEQKRTAALEREAYDRGETKWYLSVHTPEQPLAKAPLHIVSAGFSMLDPGVTVGETSSDEEADARGGGEGLGMAGRKNFGFRTEERQEQQKRSGGSLSPAPSDHTLDSNESDAEDPTGVKALIKQGRREASEKAREERRARRKAGYAESHRLAEERRKKEVNLNLLHKISAGGGILSRSDRGAMTCLRCGTKGHKAKACPQREAQN